MATCLWSRPILVQFHFKIAISSRHTMTRLKRQMPFSLIIDLNIDLASKHYYLGIKEVVLQMLKCSYHNGDCVEK